MTTSSGHLGEHRFPLEERRIALDTGVTLSVKSRGEGPPVVLLHGFPQNSQTWRKHLPMLANAGFRAISPDMRGYGGSDKPKSVGDYAPPRLVDDVRALVRALGYEKVHLVGHDWGAVVAFYVAAMRPEIVDRLVILNGPHPDAYARLLRSSQTQRSRSWYVFAFQIPLLPERLLALKGVLPRVLQKSASPGVFTEDELESYATAVRQPGAARAMVNYYRAAARYRQRLPIIKRPTLVLWAEKDVALGTELLEGLDRYIESYTVQRFPDTSHWLPEERPDEVHSAIVRFLRPS